MSTKDYTFTRKKETVDNGKDYEYLNIAHIVLNLLSDKEVKDFHIASNASDFGSFDDIVVEVERFDGTQMKYAIQLKHIDAAKHLAGDTLKGIGKFGIQKYYNSYSKTPIIKDYQLILLTNCKFNLTKNRDLTICLESGAQLRPRNGETDGTINTSEDGSCIQFDSSVELEGFDQNFYLYVNQLSAQTLKGVILRKFKELFHCVDDVCLNYLQFVQDWCKKIGTNTMLHKLWVKQAVAARLLSQFEPISFNGSSRYRNFRRVIDMFNVSLFSQELAGELAQIWEDDHNVCDRDVNITRTKFGQFEKTRLWWLMGKCPLIVAQSEVVLEAIKLYPEGKYILLQTSDSVSLVGTVFKDLSDIPDHEVYKLLVREAKCCLQGAEVSLESLLQQHEDLRCKVTTNHVFRMLGEETFVVGGKEDLPEPYIERSLSVTIIDGEFLKHLAKSGQKVVVVLSRKERFKEFECSSVEDFLKSPKVNSGLNILLSDYCSQEQFDEICKTTKESCHHFVVTEEGHLEWVKSKGELCKIEGFQLNSGKVIETELYSSTSGNNINIVCAKPGLGKSTLAKNLKNHLSSKYWTTIVHSNDLIDDIEILQCFSDFDKAIMQSFKSKKLMAYIWDGLDELSDDQLAKVLDLIQDLSNQGFLQWITARGHLKETLEKRFKVFVRTILQFDEQQQEDYIAQRLGSNNTALAAIKDNIRMTKTNEVLGIPLQIYMLTELFIRNDTKYTKLLENAFTLTDLYAHFVNDKFDWYYKDKAEVVNVNLPLQNILKEHKESRIEKYEEAALRTLDDDVMTSDYCTRFLGEIRSNGDDFGFITAVSEKLRPVFLHNSYGEFFVACYFFKNYQKVESLKKILFRDRYANIRFLFDLLMAEGCPTHVAVLHQNFSLFTQDLDYNRRDKGGRNALQLASTWGQRYPLLNTQPVAAELVNDKLAESVEQEDDDYKNIIRVLLEECDCNERDHIFGMDAAEYADSSFCLYPLLQIVHKTGRPLNHFHNFSDIPTVLYYTLKFDWDHILSLLPNPPLIKTEKRSLSSIHLCAKFGSNRCLVRLLRTDHKVLIDVEDTYRTTPITIACKRGHHVILKTLLGSGASLPPKVYTLVNSACKGGHEKVVKILLDQAAGAPFDANATAAMQTACLNGYHEIVRLLIDVGVDVNANARYGTPLYIASQYGYLNIVRMLVDDPKIVVDKPNKYNFTPLHIACQMNRLEVVKLLLQHANVDVVDKTGLSPLHIACRSGTKDLVQLLVDAGANVDVTCNKKGFTALHHACQNGDEDIVGVLVERGAKVDALCKAGNKPRDLACENGHSKVEKMLLGGNLLHLRSLQE